MTYSDGTPIIYTTQQEWVLGGGNTTVYIAVGRALDVTADRTTGEQYFEYGNNLDHWRGGEEGKFKML